MMKISLKRIAWTGSLAAAALIYVLAAPGGPVSAQSSSDDCEKEKKAEKVAREASSAPAVVRVLDRNRVAINAREALAPLPVQNGTVIEKAIAVRSNVYVSLCVKQGSVRINGWSRDEVRAFIGNGKDLGFKVIERSGDDKKPVWIEVLGYQPSRKNAIGEKCLTGDEIELDVPEGASVTIKGLSSETAIDSVKRASVEIVGGDILLNNVSDRIEASTQQGGVTVNNSKGKMALSTTTGNIVAFNTESVDIGDYFKAKTRSGAVTLQSIGQKQVLASSISGSISYVGGIMAYGQYDFSTTNGMLNVIIPQASCFSIIGALGGEFLSEFPIEILSEEKRGDSEAGDSIYFHGKVGGECEDPANVSVKSFNGTIRLRRQNSTGEPVQVTVD